MSLHIFRHKTKWIQAESGGEKFLRFILLIGCISLVGWGFWENGKRHAEHFNASSRIKDEVGILTDAQKNEVREILISSEEKYNAKIALKINNRPIASVDAPENSIFIGICPQYEQVVFIVPPLIRKSMGEKFIFEMRNSIMLEHFKNNTVGEGVLEMVRALERHFDLMISGLS